MKLHSPILEIGGVHMDQQLWSGLLDDTTRISGAGHTRTGRPYPWASALFSIISSLKCFDPLGRATPHRDRVDHSLGLVLVDTLSGGSLVAKHLVRSLGKRGH